ncbi:uncharacterized protein L201_005345 [Kwoniella dendrophila CBS 6074]|uniref:Signal peptidase complex subunit 2 n=1 Tax=Kwoniella dendrophila CBS 6074 TaxID=1295534 RepID=A0AAX4K0V2_9TREE
MAPRKPANGGNTTPITTTFPGLEPAITSTTTSTTGKESDVGSTLATDPLPVVHVNNANLGEIKSALDDIVKSHLQKQSFKPSLLHPTVHLSLGYSSILLALGSCLYSYKVEFENSKTILWIAVIGYFFLQSLLYGWKKWIEKGEVFKGKRRRMVKRIETDHIHIISSTSLDSPPLPQLTFSPHTRPSSPTSSNSVPTSPIPSLSSPSSSLPIPSSSSSSSSTAETNSVGPSYNLQLTLSITSNNGKSLIHKSRSVVGKSIGQVIDEQGGVEKNQFTRWLTNVLNDSGLVGIDDLPSIGNDNTEISKEE